MLSHKQIEYALSAEVKDAHLDANNGIMYVACHTRFGVYCLAFDHANMTLMRSASFLVTFRLLAQINMKDWPYPSVGGQRAIMESQGDEYIVRLRDSEVTMSRDEHGHMIFTTKASGRIPDRKPLPGEEWILKGVPITISSVSKHSVKFYGSKDSVHNEVTMYAFEKHAVPSIVKGVQS